MPTHDQESPAPAMTAALAVDHFMDKADALRTARRFDSELAVYRSLADLLNATADRDALIRFAARLDRQGSRPKFSRIGAVNGLKERAYRAALDLEDDPAFSRALGILLADRSHQKFAEAVPLLRKAYDAGLRDHKLVGALAFSLLGVSEADRCVELLREWILEAPLDIVRPGLLVRILRLLDRLPAEHEAVRNTLTQKGWAERRLTVYFARICVALGRSSGALEVLRSVLSTEPERPDDATILAALSVAYDDLGRAEEARGALQRALAVEPSADELGKALQKLDRDAALARDVAHRRTSAAALNRGGKRIALMLSGFVRDFRHAHALQQLFKKFPQHQIDVFAQVFDRLGDLRIPFGMPAELSDYSHGGFYREIQKTPPLNQDRFNALFGPKKTLWETRADDAHYIDAIGMKHPQWRGVQKCFQLVADHCRDTGCEYDAVVRSRFDIEQARIPIDFGPIPENTLITPANLVYGHPRFAMCDRVAIGSFTTMQVYCGIGADRNFVDLEADAYWQAEIGAEYLDSHETHMGYWLWKHGIDVVKEPSMII